MLFALGLFGRGVARDRIASGASYRPPVPLRGTGRGADARPGYGGGLRGGGRVRVALRRGVLPALHPDRRRWHQPLRRPLVAVRRVVRGARAVVDGCISRRDDTAKPSAPDRGQRGRARRAGGPGRVLPRPTGARPVRGRCPMAWTKWSSPTSRHPSGSIGSTTTNASNRPMQRPSPAKRRRGPARAAGVFLVWNGEYRGVQGQCEAVLDGLSAARGGGQVLVPDGGGEYFEHAQLVWFPAQT